MSFRLNEQPERKWVDHKKAADYMGVEETGNEFCLTIRRMENWMEAEC